MTFHHVRRLNRALYHLDCFEAEKAAWRKEGPHAFRTERDAERGKKVLWAQVVKPPPASLSLIAGDCIHNLRAALDNLAFELALAKAKGPLPSGVASDSGFPIFATDPAKAKRPEPLEKFNDMLRGVDPLAKAVIESLQPYNREDGFRSDRLWQLNKLEVIYKHRLPPTATLSMLGALSFFPRENIGIDEIQTLWRYFDSSAPIAEYPAVDSTGADVHMDFTAAFDVCFSHGVPDWLLGASVRETLKGFHRHIVNEVLPPLRKFLTHH